MSVTDTIHISRKLCAIPSLGFENTIDLSHILGVTTVDIQQSVRGVWRETTSVPIQRVIIIKVKKTKETAEPGHRHIDISCTHHDTLYTTSAWSLRCIWSRLSCAIMHRAMTPAVHPSLRHFISYSCASQWENFRSGTAITFVIV